MTAININKILTNNILKLILAIFIIEAFSLLSFKIAWLSAIFFVIIIIGVILFALYKLEYGLYLALIELMIGSYGYLFYLQLPGFKIPIRLGIFLTLVIIWGVRYGHWRRYLQLLKKDRLTQNLVVFFLFLALGIINGYLHRNGLKSIFFDVNNYLYLGLFFIFLDVFQSVKQVSDWLQIFLASLIYLSLKIFVTLYIFTHGFGWLVDLFYIWIRDTRVGEITWAGGSFFRIFVQSQIYSLIGIFLISVWLVKLTATNRPKKNIKSLFSKLYQSPFTWLYLILIILETSILISFSRSFWLGGFIAGLALVIYLLLLYKKQIKTLAKTIGILLLSTIFSVGLMILIVNFPLPTPSGIFSAEMLKNRFTTGDAAASSRWNLLPIIINKIKQAPLLGTGFGTTLTYQTEDPRIKNEQNPKGWYTTYTFEWGYLDTMTEIGALGLIVYLLFLGQIFWQGIKLYKTQYSWLATGLLLGLIALIATHIFSPYLNHPLGLGYLMTTIAIFQIIKKDGQLSFNHPSSAPLQRGTDPD